MKLLLPVWEGHMVVSGLANLRPNALITITGLRTNIDIAAVYSRKCDSGCRVQRPNSKCAAPQNRGVNGVASSVYV